MFYTKYHYFIFFNISSYKNFFFINNISRTIDIQINLNNLNKLKIRKVKFKEECKKYDGTSKQNEIYFLMLFNFFTHKLKKPLDIFQITKNKDIISYCLSEAKIAENKLFEMLFENLKNKIYKKPSISIMRKGSRDYSYKFNSSHIKDLQNFIKILETALYLF